MRLLSICIDYFNHFISDNVVNPQCTLHPKLNRETNTPILKYYIIQYFIIIIMLAISIRSPDITL